jgi:polysaccharide export outer membrane protein
MGSTQPNRAKPGPALQDDAYILGAGDSLDLKLFDAPELSGALDVLNDGTVSLPLIGSVRVQGLTLSQAQLWFTGLFRKQLQRPDLQLKVVRPRPIRVALVGEVERPGIYSLTTSESTQTEGGPTISVSGLPTLVDALQKAGGITLNANLRDVTLQRRLPGEAPSYKRATLNLLDLVFEGDQQQNPLLFDGDTIRVGRAAQPVPESVALASTTLTAKRITVYVVGEVERPGATEVSANIPLVQAVLAAGGPKLNRASRSNVELVRINRNGTATRERFQLDLGQGASNAKNPPLREGDAVIVNRNGLAVASDALNAVGQPLTSVVNVWALTKLVQ